MYREKNQCRHKLGEEQCDGLDLKKSFGKNFISIFIVDKELLLALGRKQY